MVVYYKCFLHALPYLKSLPKKLVYFLCLSVGKGQKQKQVTLRLYGGVLSSEYKWDYYSVLESMSDHLGNSGTNFMQDRAGLAWPSCVLTEDRIILRNNFYFKHMKILNLNNQLLSSWWMRGAWEQLNYLMKFSQIKKAIRHVSSFLLEELFLLHLEPSQ